MTENDKILINAFLDNEASSEEIKYVEDLIEKNEEALKYLNMLKKANIEFNKFRHTFIKIEHTHGQHSLKLICSRIVQNRKTFRRILADILKSQKWKTM